MSRFFRRQEGSSTIEFVLILPAFILIFLSTFETGMLMTRHVMLDRALDIAVRQVRLGTLGEVSHANLVETICDNIVIMDDCTSELRLEMEQLNPRAMVLAGDEPECINREDRSEPITGFTPGGRNELMILRACALFDPILPTTGIGSSLPRKSGGAYALLATSSYSVEP